MRKATWRQWTVLFLVLATIVVNLLANAIPYNGLTTGEISDRFDVYFVPAGYVFSIWGLIYLGLMAFAVFQLLPGQRDNDRLARVFPLFALSCLANMGWLFAWHYEQFALTVPIMLVLLVSLIGVYLQLGIGRTRPRLGERWCVDIPFSVYLGWITVATIANITELLDYVGWSGWGIGGEAWALIMFVATLVIAFAIALSRRDVAYVLVLVWALAGVAVRNAGTATAAGAWVTVALLVVAAIAAVLTRRRPGVSRTLAR
ncbi:MAG: tryptophan-rich sensory protein [Coriobacteriia bacterium]